MKIVSGRTGSPHVTSQQFRQMLEGIIGQGSYIITSGENLKPELSSNNLLKIRSGMMAHHGCISCVDIGTYDEVTLTNGSQGMKRIDLIVNRYTRNAETEVENCSWKVIQCRHTLREICRMEILWMNARLLKCIMMESMLQK